LAPLLFQLTRLFALLPDHCFRCVRGEALVLETLAGPGELAADTLDLRAQTRRLALDVDDALERHEELGSVVQHRMRADAGARARPHASDAGQPLERGTLIGQGFGEDRKSTRLNSSHVKISYAVFCLKKKTPQSI